MEYYVFVTKRDETDGWMDGCIVWWRANGKGYTYDLNFAGLFTEDDKAKRYPDPSTCTYVPREIVDANSYSPRLAFWDRTRSGVESPIMDALAQRAALLKSSTPQEEAEARKGGQDA